MLVQLGFLEHLTDDILGDALVTQLAGQQPLATRTVLGAVLHPPLGELLIVQIAPAAHALDSLIDGRLAELTPAEAVPYLTLRARPVADEGERALDRPFDLINCEQFLDVVGGELDAAPQVAPDRLDGRQ